MLLGVDVGGTFTDAVLIAPDGDDPHRQGPLHTRRGGRRGDASSRAGARAGRRAPGAGRALRPRDDGRDERTAGGPDRADGAGGNGRLHRRRRARSPEPRRSCTASPSTRPRRWCRRSCASARRSGSGHDGILQALDPSRARALVERIRDADPEAVAVSLLHSYADASHERAIGVLLRRAAAGGPGVAVERAGRDIPRVRANRDHGARRRALPAARALSVAASARQAAAAGLGEPQIMQSSGGLTDAVSGRRSTPPSPCSRAPPAASPAHSCWPASADEPNVACFDMGGTSCDVCLIESGQVPETAERVIAGRPRRPSGAGHPHGRRGRRLDRLARPGRGVAGRPRLGGSRPGTRLLRQGRRAADGHRREPAAGPPAGGLAAGRRAATRPGRGRASRRAARGPARPRAAGLRRRNRAGGGGRDARRVAADDCRARASTPAPSRCCHSAGPVRCTRSRWPRGLAVSRVLCPRASGVLSALGLAAAAPRRDAARTVMLRGGSLSRASLAQDRDALIAEARGALGEAATRVRVRHELRYRGQSFELPVEEEREPGQSPRLGPQELREAFGEAHDARYGYRDEEAELELVNIRASALGRAPKLRLAAASGREPAVEMPSRVVRRCERADTGAARRAGAGDAPWRALRCSRCPTRRCWCRRAGRGGWTPTGRSRFAAERRT